MDIQYRDVIEYLEHLAGGGKPKVSGHGLCRQLSVMFGEECLDIPSLYCKTWDHRSWNINYPVPDPEGGCPKEIFWKHSKEYMWGNNPYGNLRRDLCRHIAKCLREEYSIDGEIYK